MPPRLFIDHPIAHAAEPTAPIALPEAAARHVQVLRLQPGSPVVLFDGAGGEWTATVSRMGRSDVDVRLESHDPVDRELPLRIVFAMGMPTNERMDGLIEKATELGAAGFVPLMCERSVLRLAGERAERKVQHWQGVARAACEQSGRTRVPAVAPIQTLAAWLSALPGEGAAGGGARWILSLRDAAPLASRLQAARELLGTEGAEVLVLSGPEGGLSEAEETLARGRGFLPVSLGPRVLRADTAPPAVVAQIGFWLTSTTARAG